MEIIRPFESKTPLELQKYDLSIFLSGPAWGVNSPWGDKLLELVCHEGGDEYDICVVSPQIEQLDSLEDRIRFALWRQHYLRYTKATLCWFPFPQPMPSADLDIEHYFKNTIREIFQHVPPTTNYAGTDGKTIVLGMDTMCQQWVMENKDNPAFLNVHECLAMAQTTWPRLEIHNSLEDVVEELFSLNFRFHLEDDAV